MNKNQMQLMDDYGNNIFEGIGGGSEPYEQIVAPEQTATITSETDPETGVPITLAEGIDLSTFSKADILGLRVSINGEAATFGDNEWTIEVDDGIVLVIPVVNPDDENSLIGFALSAGNPETQSVLPGNYTVEITRMVAENPMLKAFPVVAGESDSFPWVVDATIDEVDAAMTAGCVMLYAADPDNRSGFAFGIIVGRIAYYATLTNSSFEWKATSVFIVDGKYALFVIT